MEGYKIFNKGLINRYGYQYKEGKNYKVSTKVNPIEYGNNGYGIHFVKRLEDGLRYFDGMNEDIDIAEVTSLGEIREFYDDYYGYYDLYVTDNLKINHVLTREEIIEQVLNMQQKRVKRFISGYKLTEEEITKIINRFKTDEIVKAIDYYQRNIKDVYEKEKIYRKENLYDRYKHNSSNI